METFLYLFEVSRTEEEAAAAAVYTMMGDMILMMRIDMDDTPEMEVRMTRKETPPAN
jgi:hypothetical protein